jgi:DNA-binding IclR family transcriptional regulator
LNLKEITELTGLTKNKAFRILATLTECQFIDRTADGNYFLHVRFLEFEHQVSMRLNIVELGGPILDELVAETQESAFISIVDGDMALCVAARESLSQIRLAASAGRRLPLYAGATPIILLAYMPEAERAALLDRIELTPITPETITDRATLDQYLTKVREQGYVLTPEDLTEGARGVGAPIRDFTGKVVASLSISGIAPHFTGERADHYIEVVLAATEKLSRSLGYKPVSAGRLAHAMQP